MLLSLLGACAPLPCPALQGGASTSGDVHSAGLPTSSAAHDMIPMDALGEPYQRLARNNKVRRSTQQRVCVWGGGGACACISECVIMALMVRPPVRGSCVVGCLG